MSHHLQEASKKKHDIREYQGYLVALAAAVVCFVIAYFMREAHKTTYDISRDVGMAISIALIVTLLYELHARWRYDRNNFINALSVIMNEIVHKDVWEEVRTQIIDKDMIRVHCSIRLKVKHETGLKKNQMLLSVEFEYELHSLKSKPKLVTIRHYLDSHIKCPEKKLPRFELIEVGDAHFSHNALRRRTKKGVFTFAKTLKPRDEGHLQVRSRRQEITYVPGSYNLVMGEICSGLTIVLDEIPHDVEASVRVWPSSKPVRLWVDRTVDDYQSKILLPGQGCEFIFHLKH